MGHSDRAHALLSASGAHRWMACTPSARLEEQFPDTTSEAAREGTLAHELAELKLRNYFYTVDFGKRKLSTAINKLKKDELWQDEMLGYTDDYLDYVKTVALKFKSQPYTAIEKQVDLTAYIPDGFGTADCILIGGSVLHVIDFKYGKSPNGRVSAERNPQMMLYALGAYEAYKILYDITDVHMSIVQPRLPDGISEWSCSLDTLLGFGETVKAKAELAILGEGKFAPSEKTCQFCRAKGKCRARADENIKLAFSPDVGRKPPLLSNEEMGDYLIRGADVAKWLTELQACALAECLAGNRVPGWKAVEGRGPREWVNLDVAFATLKSHGIDEAVLWERKPLSVAQVEKVMGEKDFELAVGPLVAKSPGKPTLVKESDKRVAITNKVSAAEAFGKVEG